ncbi:MAG: PD-(D/E)XK nuclease family protein, partial [Myxococcales bacterium FL481]
MRNMRVITNSERTSFACERRWAFGYLAGLTTGDSAAPLRQGSLLHRMLAALYTSIMLKRDPLTIEELWREVVEPWLEQRTTWLDEQRMHGAEAGSEWIEDAQARDREIASESRHMVAGYIDHWLAQDLDRWEILGVEEQVARVIINPVNGKPLTDVFTMPDGKRIRRRWVYGGAVDLRIWDRMLGGQWLVEHKSTAETDLSEYCRKLHWDPQIRGYPWAMLRPAPDLLDDHRPAEDLRGVIYNVLRKKVPR